MLRLTNLAPLTVQWAPGTLLSLPPPLWDDRPRLLTWVLMMELGSSWMCGRYFTRLAVFPASAKSFHTFSEAAARTCNVNFCDAAEVLWRSTVLVISCINHEDQMYSQLLLCAKGRDVYPRRQLTWLSCMRAVISTWQSVCLCGGCLLFIYPLRALSSFWKCIDLFGGVGSEGKRGGLRYMASSLPGHVLTYPTCHGSPHYLWPLGPPTL